MQVRCMTTHALCLAINLPSDEGNYTKENSLVPRFLRLVLAGAEKEMWRTFLTEGPPPKTFCLHLHPRGLRAQASTY